MICDCDGCNRLQDEVESLKVEHAALRTTFTVLKAEAAAQAAQSKALASALDIYASEVAYLKEGEGELIKLNRGQGEWIRQLLTDLAHEEALRLNLIHGQGKAFDLYTEGVRAMLTEKVGECDRLRKALTRLLATVPSVLGGLITVEAAAGFNAARAHAEKVM